MKFPTTKKLSYLLLILIAFSGLFCTKVEDPIVGWGNKITLETGSTSAPATSSSVVIGGSTISCRVSSLADKERGICWSESSTGVSVTGSKLPVGRGTGSFPATITGLLPAKTYYYRAYILLAAPSSALYGDLKTFSTPAGCPTFTSTAVATPTSANFAINITSNGGATVTSCGVVYSSTVTSPIIGQAGCTNAQSTTTPIIGTNNISVTGLTQATSYYVRAWATNSGGQCYGPVYIVTTGANLATLTTSAVTTYTSTTATLGGNITDDGGTAITLRGVVISSTTSTPSVLDNSPTTGATGCTSLLANPSTGTGSYSIQVTGLSASTTYYVRAWAKNSAPTVSYGNITSFTTPAQIVCPTMTTAAITTFTNTTATLGEVSQQ